jgi:NADPH2:quinone reductase
MCFGLISTINRDKYLMNAIVINATGGPEQLKFQERTVRTPGPGEALVDVAAAGVNFMDVGVRIGMYLRGPLPTVLGVEGAGRVAAVGSGVTDLQLGQRVAWFYVPGSYAQQLIAPAASLVALPDEIDFETAAGLMMQGLTASHFVTETYAIKPGDIALVHSAAGGVGLMLTQLIKHLGGTVIGRVSSQDKVEIAKAAGAHEVIVAANGEFSDQVLRLTAGEGVHVAYDGAGADTFYGSLASLRRHGVLAYYGQTIKRLPPIDLLDLPKSVLVTYPTVMDHVPTRTALLSRSEQLFRWVQDGTLKVRIGHRYPLAQAAQAHSDIESRRTTGKLLLLP